jgi:hypothetical protein
MLDGAQVPGVPRRIAYFASFDLNRAIVSGSAR